MAGRKVRSGSPPAPGDEDTFVIPAAWRRYVHPRRGDLTARPAVTDARAAMTDARAVANVIEEHRNLTATVLADPESSADLVTAARAYLAGGPATPRGAAAAVAAVAFAAARGANARTVGPGASVIVDGMVRPHGVVLAARAMAELVDIEVYGGRLREVEAKPNEPVRQLGLWLPLLRRVRAHLTVAADVEHQAARDALAAYRARGSRYGGVTSYLMPDQDAWVEEECRERPESALLLYSVGTGDQLVRVASRVSWTSSLAVEACYTIAAAVGPPSAPTLASMIPVRGHGDAGPILDALSHFPTDEAFRLLLARLDDHDAQSAVRNAAARYPRRALRLLSVAAHGQLDGASAPVAPAVARVAADVLLTHVAADPSLVVEVLPELPAPVRAQVEALLQKGVGISPAPESSLPRVLVDPPWASRRADPIVRPALALRPVVPEPAMVWAPGERQVWLASRGEVRLRQRTRSWAQWSDEVAARETKRTFPQLLVQAPEDLVRPLLPTFRPDEIDLLGGWQRAIVARFELDALPLILDIAQSHVASFGPALLPFGSADVAPVMADWLARLRSGRATARAWLHRHAALAAAVLIPVWLGPPGQARDAAEAALREVQKAGQVTVLRDAARAYGPDAVEGVDALVSIDPLEVVPARMPALPGWLATAGLPPVLLRDRVHALPEASVRYVCQILSISTLDDVYPGVAILKDVCDPRSLARFAADLFDRWRAARLPATEGWVLDAVGLLGDDEAVRMLAPAMRSWPGDGGFPRALKAVHALATIETDLALWHLRDLLDRTTSIGLADRTRELLAAVAARRGLSADQLCDRLIPGLGVEPGGTVRLDYGARAFVVGFDEHLRPVVSDVDGKRRTGLPKPGAKDDAALAAQAQERFAALKKQAQTLATDEIRRLERAMLSGRRWSGGDLRDVLLAHPLMRRLAGGLVWGVYDAGGRLATVLRVAEDHTFADVNDDPVELAWNASVGIVHPAELADGLAAWTSLLADYETLQPFPQLGRDIYHLTEAERASTRLTRFEGLIVPAKRVRELSRRGWHTAEPEERVQGWVHRPVPRGRTVVVRIDPGFTGSVAPDPPDQRIMAAWVHDAPDGAWEPSGVVTFGELDVTSVSEILRDLEFLKG